MGGELLCRKRGVPQPQLLPSPLDAVCVFSDLPSDESSLKYLHPKAPGITATAETAAAGLELGVGTGMTGHAAPRGGGSRRGPPAPGYFVINAA